MPFRSEFGSAPKSGIALRAGSLAFLLAITALGAWLRAERLGTVPLWLDEILNVPLTRGSSALSWFEWLVPFERENGPLYYLLARIGMSLPFPLEMGFRLFPLLAGVAAIPLIDAVARRATASRAAGLVAAALLAVSPLHVHYSREGRPYAVLVVCALVATWSILGRPRAVLFTGALFAAAATAATAVPLIVAAVTTTLLFAIGQSERRLFLQCAAGGIAALAWSALYLRFEQAAAAPLNDGATELGALVLNSFATTSGRSGVLAPAAVAAALLAIAGFVLLRERRAARVLGLMTVLPVLATFAGLAVADHWYSVRYTIHGLPAYLVLVSAGGVELLRAAWSRGPKWRPATTAAAVLALALSGWLLGGASLRALDDRFERADWRKVATALAVHARNDDLVIASGEWAAVSIRHYLEELGRPLDVRSVNGSVETAEGLLGRRTHAWVLSGGWEEASEFRRWACAFFPVLSAPEESIRLSFARDLPAFVQHRATEKERSRFEESFAESHGGAIHLGFAGNIVGTGFYGPEGVPYRWARRSATLRVPVPAGTEIVSVRMAPFSEARRTQSVTATVGDAPPVEWVLESEPATYSLAVPRADALRIVPVRFDFAWEISPAQLGTSGDVRPLAASIHWVATGAGAGRGEGAFPLLLMADGAEPPFKPNRESTPIAWSERGLAEFQRRLGLPSEIRPSDAPGVATALLAVLPPAECVSDRAFLEAVYRTLLGRAPDRVGSAFYLARLRSGDSRHDVVRRIAEGEGFGSDRWLSTLAENN